ncbi:MULTISPECIES: rod shape-determining protein MreD [Gordonibacter]|uniref:Rod shape-determining protein MreD n=1 Tax=Gordonibacter pamelaeae TaxID=471189 RepID=A0A369M6U7_9ACTN|nr:MULTISPECIES: rod shape-determining protein MreD [Gordonibacter]MCB6313492.1 rod shape-determining protein MreD [Gordonibacter pamelaeae]MCB6563189.1 rod shape-determining protein MreD [Gordonibacter urolithinfaciens]RDB66205.1 rod shape-determining protein MreD [Gordonibacter pamelaeae]
MNVTRDGIAVAVGAVVAVLLQVVVAPNIALFGAMPNFVVAYALLVAIVRPMAAGPVMPFVLGLVFDLVSGGPVGAMAFLLVLMTFLAARAFAVLDNDTLFMPLVIFVAATVLVEALYAAFLLALGFDASALDVFLYRALPCALYDCVIGLVLYPLAARVLAGAAPAQPGTPRLR